MSEQNKFYVLIHMEDLQFVNTGGEWFTADVMQSIKFDTLAEAATYREGFDEPEAFQIYEVNFSHSLKKIGENEYARNR